MVIIVKWYLDRFLRLYVCSVFSYFLVHTMFSVYIVPWIIISVLSNYRFQFDLLDSLVSPWFALIFHIGALHKPLYIKLQGKLVVCMQSVFSMCIVTYDYGTMLTVLDNSFYYVHRMLIVCTHCQIIGYNLSLPKLSVFICWINLVRTAHMYSVVEVIISFKFHINLCFMYSKT